MRLWAHLLICVLVRLGSPSNLLRASGPAGSSRSRWQEPLLQACCLWTSSTPRIDLKWCCWPPEAYSQAMLITNVLFGRSCCGCRGSISIFESISLLIASNYRCPVPLGRQANRQAGWPFREQGSKPSPAAHQDHMCGRSQHEP